VNSAGFWVRNAIPGATYFEFITFKEISGAKVTLLAGITNENPHFVRPEHQTVTNVVVESRPGNNPGGS